MKSATTRSVRMHWQQDRNCTSDAFAGGGETIAERMADGGQDMGKERGSRAWGSME